MLRKGGTIHQVDLAPNSRPFRKEIDSEPLFAFAGMPGVGREQAQQPVPLRLGHSG